MPSLLDQVSCHVALAEQPDIVVRVSTIYQDPDDDPKRLPLIITLPLITVLSLGLWAGIGLITGILPLD